MAYLGEKEEGRSYISESEVGTEEFLCLSREQRVGTGLSQVAITNKKNSSPHAVKVKRLRAILSQAAGPRHPGLSQRTQQLEKCKLSFC